MKNETLLHEEIQGEFEKLKDMQLGTDEYKTTVDGLTKLVDKAIEIDKLNVEHEEKIQDREDEKKDRFVKNCITGIGTVGGLLMTYWGTKKTFKFEETGTITSAAGRNFINKVVNYFSKK